jgi:hypothetical protein
MKNAFNELGIFIIIATLVLGISFFADTHAQNPPPAPPAAKLSGVATINNLVVQDGEGDKQRIICSCDFDEKTALYKNCAFQNGGTLDDLMNAWVKSYKLQQADHDRIMKEIEHILEILDGKTK